MACTAQSGGSGAIATLAAPRFDLPSATPLPCSYPNLKKKPDARLQLSKRVFRRVSSAEENDASLRMILRRFWGHRDFRGPQLEICRHVVGGCDVLFVAPTGLGKSVCFQVPALTLEWGVTIVVSPLIALMQDQVSNMEVCLLRGGRSVREVAMIYDKTTKDELEDIKLRLNARHPEIRLLYTTPETLMGNKIGLELRKAYNDGQILRLVVDEAHVIDEWGTTFRPKIRQTLGDFRVQFPNVPITAVTASATEEVRQDIVTLLRISGDNFVQWVEPFNRKNLFYEVRYHAGDLRPHDKHEAILKFILQWREEARERNKENGILDDTVSGIIYCGKRSECYLMASFLKKRGITAGAFEANMDTAEKRKTLADWKSGKLECVVATIAFGMGIDAPHVRYVVHHDAPNSFQGYYQETGRAGRDEHISKCVVYYSREDAGQQRRLRKRSGEYAADKAIKARENELEAAGEQPMSDEAKADFRAPFLRGYSSLKALHHHLEDSGTCRHVGVCRYFGEEIDDKDPYIVQAYCDKMCDVCVNRDGVRLGAARLNDEIDPPSPVIRSRLQGLPEASDLEPVIPADSFMQFDAAHDVRPRMTTTISTPSAARSLPTLCTRMITTGPIVLKKPRLVQPSSFFDTSGMDGGLPASVESSSSSSTSRRTITSTHEADDEMSSPSVAARSRSIGTRPLVGTTETQPVQTDETPSRAPPATTACRTAAAGADAGIKRRRESVSMSRKQTKRQRRMIPGIITTDDVTVDDSGVFAQKGRMPLDPRKRQQQEDKFLAIQPADTKAGGPHSYYLVDSGTKTSRTMTYQKEFRPPLRPVSAVPQQQAEPLAPGPADDPVFAIDGNEMRTKRQSARAGILAELETLFIQDPRAGAWWRYVLDHEVPNRRDTLSRAAKRAEQEIAESAPHETTYERRLEGARDVIYRLKHSDIAKFLGMERMQRHDMAKWAHTVKGWFLA